jgi:hypothetical protein
MVKAMLLLMNWNNSEHFSVALICFGTASDPTP